VLVCHVWKLLDPFPGYAAAEDDFFSAVTHTDDGIFFCLGVLMAAPSRLITLCHPSRFDFWCHFRGYSTRAWVSILSWICFPIKSQGSESGEPQRASIVSIGAAISPDGHVPISDPSAPRQTSSSDKPLLINAPYSKLLITRRPGGDRERETIAMKGSFLQLIDLE